MYFFSVKPYFLQEPEDVTAMKGEDIVLDCDVSGDPSPTILWHREDGTLPHGRTSIQNGKLSIQDVTPKDEGVYVCEAQNTVGTISVSATLSVHGKLHTTKFCAKRVQQYFLFSSSSQLFGEAQGPESGHERHCQI